MSEDKFKLDTIESALRDIRDGKVVIVVDDKNRENEGDFLAAAELITPEIINFMATHGRGLICAPITENISKKLGLNLILLFSNSSMSLQIAFCNNLNQLLVRSFFISKSILN